MTASFAVVVPWADCRQMWRFKREWGIGEKVPSWLLFQQDMHREGCGATKNKGVARAASSGAELVVVLDDDCYPAANGPFNLEELADLHRLAMEPQPVEMFQAVTEPPSRGTPYAERTMTMPVAASMGFWENVGDHCAVRQLATGGAPMMFVRTTVFGRYFPLCGMNLAFKPQSWLPWCTFIEVPRFDDIWMGWLWQREAYRRGYCFSTQGPTIRHARQSNVWRNLAEEMRYLRRNETLWREIAASESGEYDELRAMLPCG